MSAHNSTDPRRRSLLAAVGGKTLLALGPAKACANATGALSNRSNEWLSIADFSGADKTGASPSNVAISACAAASRRVFIPEGTFAVNGAGIECPADTTFAGVGAASVIKQADMATAQLFHVDSGSANPADNIRGLRFHSLKLLGLAATRGFSEHQHLMRFSGVTDLVVEEVLFEAFRGDGLYLGSGDAPGIERHNQRVVVRKCTFDGFNRDNRNCISVIDCEGITIERSTFLRSTRSNMPGPIDFEPNGHVWHVIRDVTIQGNHFSDNGGVGGSITFYFPDLAYTRPPSNIVVEGNVIEGASVSDPDHGLTFHHAGAAGVYRPKHALTVRGNTITGTAYGFRLFGLHGGLFAGNKVIDTLAGPLIAFGGGKTAVRELEVSSNHFIRLAKDNVRGGEGISVFDASYVDFIDNEFVDCGRENGSQGYVLRFQTGKSDHLRLKGNRLSNPSRRTTRAVKKEPGHVFAPATNESDGNNWAGLASDFQS